MNSVFSAFDEQCMDYALGLAEKAQLAGEVPVGAVLALNGEILSEGFNQSIQQADPTAHAEIITLRLAAKKIGNYRLLHSVLYTSLEPCCMCAGAIIHARVQRVVCATRDPRAGAGGSVFNLLNSDQLNHHIEMESGLFAEKSHRLLQNFFQIRRRRAR
ncbi:MAG: tRNA adenosine(34) deaminase TadA [Gammaproteobacteria bacterium]|nr:tRNA adenosine(34) deaminase TadA [Gammaproteobacteria bacterium]